MKKSKKSKSEKKSNRNFVLKPLNEETLLPDYMWKQEPKSIIVYTPEKENLISIQLWQIIMNMSSLQNQNNIRLSCKYLYTNLTFLKAVRKNNFYAIASSLLHNKVYFGNVVTCLIKKDDHQTEIKGTIY